MHRSVLANITDFSGNVNTYVKYIPATLAISSCVLNGAIKKPQVVGDLEAFFVRGTYCYSLVLVLSPSSLFCFFASSANVSRSRNGSSILLVNLPKPSLSLTSLISLDSLVSLNVRSVLSGSFLLAILLSPKLNQAKVNNNTSPATKLPPLIHLHLTATLFQSLLFSSSSSPNTSFFVRSYASFHDLDTYQVGS